MGIRNIEHINSDTGANAVEFGDLCSGPNQTSVIDYIVSPVGGGTTNITDNSTTVKGDGNVVNSNNGINNTIVKNVDSNNKGNLIGIIFTIIGIIIAW